MVRNREEAARVAEANKTNVPGTCQLETRNYYLAASAGDFDGDGASDAEDGWKKEPARYKHVGDRNPPRGVPVSFLGGSRDNGHRAISLGNHVIRSTDFNGATKRYQAGVVGNGTIDQVANAMGVSYAGWSDTIDGELIPLPVKAPVKKTTPAKPAKPSRVSNARVKLERALTTAVRKKKKVRAAAIRAALKSLPKR